MFSWIGKDERRKKEPEVFANVADGLKRLYKQKLLPLEEHYKFHDFHSPPLDDPDFDAKPMVRFVTIDIDLYLNGLCHLSGSVENLDSRSRNWVQVWTWSRDHSAQVLQFLKLTTPPLSSAGVVK